MSDLLLNIRTGIFKRICVWFTQNLWLRSKHWLVCALLVSYFITATLLLSTIFHTIIKKGNCIVQIIFLTCKGNVWKLAIAFKENKSTLRKQEFLQGNAISRLELGNKISMFVLNMANNIGVFLQNIFHIITRLGNWMKLDFISDMQNAHMEIGYFSRELCRSKLF